MAQLRKAVARYTAEYKRRLSEPTAVGRLALQYRRTFPREYYKYGLMSDDMYETDRPYHVDALVAEKRLPREEQEARDFRQLRATYLSANSRILPREEWTTPETDVPFLQPYIDHARFERMEKEAWTEENMPSFKDPLPANAEGPAAGERTVNQLSYWSFNDVVNVSEQMGHGFHWDNQKVVYLGRIGQKMRIQVRHEKAPESPNSVVNMCYKFLQVAKRPDA